MVGWKPEKVLTDTKSHSHRCLQPNKPKQCFSEFGTEFPQERSVFLVIFHAWQMYLLLSQEEKVEDVPDEAQVNGRMDGWMVRWLDGWMGKHRGKGT